MKNLKDILLSYFTESFNQSLREKIELWENPPKAIQILEILDECIYGALATGSIIIILEASLKNAMNKENTNLEELLKSATWRNCLFGYSDRWLQKEVSFESPLLLSRILVTS